MRKQIHTSKKAQGNIWQLQEAKAKFSEVVEKATHKGHQIITKNGEPVVVILSQAEFDKLSKPKMSLIEFFEKAPYPELDLEIEHSRDLPREIDL